MDPTTKSSPTRAWRNATDELVIAAPYNGMFVAALKETVPPRYRTYARESKRWTVGGGFQSRAVRLLLAHFPGAETPEQPTPFDLRSRSRPTSRHDQQEADS